MKHIFFIIAASSSLALSAQKKPAIHWYHGEPKKKNMGISLDKAYQSEWIKKSATPIIVAVIDGGTDVNHEDLKDVLWVNTKEVAGNGIDDDNNGYIDDINGWNFIGGADGKMVGADNLEKARVLKRMMDFYEAEGAKFDASSPEYQNYLKLKGEVLSAQASSKAALEQMEMVLSVLDEIKSATGKENPTVSDLESIVSEDDMLKQVAKRLAKGMKKEGFSFASIVGEMKEQYDYFDLRANIQNNPNFDPRSTIVGDDYANSSQRIYGNNNVVGPDASHGSHVAGIIGATRGNGKGLDGVADHVKIMVVRVVPDGDERDKDVANGIRYAVDNGAKIINMSFGKGFSWDKNIVDSAVSYAESKGVLLVHAAGNSAQDNDVTPNYPNDTLWGGTRFAANWIEVGASQPKRKKLATDFSNYGKQNVDIFAPGQDIYSAIPGDTYAYFNGTSMAAPVVSGVAALVWSRYPQLTATELKAILLESGTLVKCKVPVPGEKNKVRFTELSQTGRLINAYEALKLAEKRSPR
jgi:subtilisin family serine protease